MRVLLINDSTSGPNWGDRAAAVSLMSMIRACDGDIVYSLTEHDLRSTSFFPEDAQVKAKRSLKPLVPPVLLAMRRSLRTSLHVEEPESHSRIPATWEDFHRLGTEFAQGTGLCGDLLEAIALADVAVIHGDGAMVGNGIIPRTDLFLAYVIKKHFGRPVMICNHTADFNHSGLHKIAMNVYPMFDDVVFRDSLSVERCRHLCDGRFAPDTAFQFEPLARDTWVPVARRPTYFDVWPDTAAFDPSAPYICIGGSSKLWFETDQPSPVRLGYMALIEKLRSVYDGQIVLTASDLTDESVFRPIAKEMDLPLIPVTIPIQQAVDVVGNSDAYLGGRWHPSIFALRGGSPVIPLLAKTFKMQALTSQAGLSSDHHDVFSLGEAAEAICRELTGYLAQGAELRGRLRDWGVRMGEESWGNVSYLRFRPV